MTLSSQQGADIEKLRSKYKYTAGVSLEDKSNKTGAVDEVMLERTQQALDYEHKLEREKGTTPGLLNVACVFNQLGSTHRKVCKNLLTLPRLWLNKNCLRKPRNGGTSQQYQRVT